MTKEIVAKVGGSLMREPKHLRASMSVLAETRADVAIVNGSGDIRHEQKRWLKSAGVTPVREKDVELLHEQRRMAAYLLSQLHPQLVVVKSIDEVRNAWELRRTPIVLAHDAITEAEEVMGSDQSAALLCKHIPTNNLIKLTNTDGIYNTKGEIIGSLSYEELGLMGQTCVDAGVSNILSEARICMRVMNGYRVDNIEKALSGRAFLGSTIGGGFDNV